MTKTNCIIMYEKISKLIEFKKSIARKWIIEGKKQEAFLMGNYIKRLAEVRLRYLYQ